MAWFTPAELPENKYYIFGKEGAKKLAEEMNVPFTWPDPYCAKSICEGGDNGTPVALDEDTVTGQCFLVFGSQRRSSGRSSEYRDGSDQDCRDA